MDEIYSYEGPFEGFLSVIYMLNKIKPAFKCNTFIFLRKYTGRVSMVSACFTAR
jgi:hypothetical protein